MMNLDAIAGFALFPIVLRRFFRYNQAMNTLEGRIDRIKEQMTAAARRAGRPVEEIKLMAVSKTRSREEVEAAYARGLRLFGENRVLEAKEKFQGLLGGALGDAELHLIGHLQRNKAKAAAASVDCVQSIDKISTARSLEQQCAALGKDLSIFLEINTSGESSKEGVKGEETLFPLVEEILSLSHLQLKGLMTMAPFTDDGEAIRRSFRSLRSRRDTLSARFPHGDFSELSMGMSSDFELAIEEGSTLIRIGTGLFGARRVAMKPVLMLVLCVLLLGPFAVFGQTEGDSPAPYEDEEFPEWALNLRRGEIIFFGSLPFATLLTTLAYRSVVYAINQGSADKKSIPWGELTSGEETEVFFITLGISLSIAIADFILGEIFDEPSPKTDY